ncbi:hypothetical protein AN958_07689 [Leucoagaricus sp. SymC.cos]|nr:hypothetical protein AN958_07689 [Leucoagaricus sp. SymC.cos]
MKDGERGDFPTDIWSLGCVALYMLSGKPPGTKPRDDIASNRFDCSLGFRDLISRMLCCLPSDRLSSSALILSGITALHTDPAGGGDENTHDRPQNLIARTKGTANDTRPRRTSLEDLGHQRLKHLFSMHPQGTVKRPQITRRIVSEPLPVKKQCRIEIPCHPEERNPGEVGDRQSLKGVVPDTNKPTKMLTTGESTDQLKSIDTSCLRPQTQKHQDTHVSIRNDKTIFVEVRDTSRKGSGNKALVIDSHQNQISLYENYVSQDYLRHISPTAQYTKENLPTDLRKYYQCASVAIDQMKRRTPKFVAYSADGKFTLMSNGPPGDLEATFSHLAPSEVFGLYTEDQDESTLRIRYSQEQGLIELRRYVGGVDGKIWTKKCMTSIFSPKEISRHEWATLDEPEKDGLARLIQFSGACQKIEDMGVLDEVVGSYRPSTDPESLHRRPDRNAIPTSDTVISYVARQPNRLGLKSFRKIP